MPDAAAAVIHPMRSSAVALLLALLVAPVRATAADPLTIAIAPLGDADGTVAVQIVFTADPAIG
ncbi:MAG TPA: hypothetical protein VGE86_04030, partial [Thermoanaerobaculia bacterium]